MCNLLELNVPSKCRNNDVTFTIRPLDQTPLILKSAFLLKDGKGGVMHGAQTGFSLDRLFHFSAPAPSPLGQLEVKHFSSPASAKLPSFHGWPSLATKF